jgi:hypothetical protein
VFGAIGADGRVVEEPTVVPIPLFSAVRGPLHGAHINKSAKTAIAAISAIIPAPIPSRRVRARCAIAVLVIIKHFVLLYCLQFEQGKVPAAASVLVAVSIGSPQAPSVQQVAANASTSRLLCQTQRPHVDRLPVPA